MLAAVFGGGHQIPGYWICLPLTKVAQEMSGVRTEHTENMHGNKHMRTAFAVFFNISKLPYF